MDVDSAAEELYGLAPDEFVARRTELERAARSDGDRETARLIKQLGKPTRAAWLVNLLSRDHPETVAQLLELADLLADGMRSLSAPELQQLTRQRGRLVASITRTAVSAGQQRGHRASEATRAEVSSTLTAALADPEVAGQVRSGRLTRPASWSGFGLVERSGTGSEPSPDERSGVAPVVELAQHRREADRKRAQRRRDRLADELRQASAAVQRVGDRVEEAARTLDRARRDHDRAAQAAARAAEAMQRAEAALAELRGDDERARARVTETEQDLAAAEAALSELADPDD